MRYMMIVKHPENQGKPPQALMDAITKLGEEATKAGTMLGNGGLLPTALGSKIKMADGQLTVSDGPFTEAKEVIGGFAMFELKTKEEAVEAGIAFMELHKKHWPQWVGEMEIRPMFTAGDCPETV